ncbi:DUF6492 family protein [Brucella sp. IR073]|uniref:DUF6492 family protein n=1 Tax=unclassified Brucella TaxID=2632610 RepID=UPI003B97D336
MLASTEAVAEIERRVSGTASLVTPSYQADFERCRLLCESIDRFVTGAQKHYLLVAGHDVALFRQLEGPRREVIDERDLLPSWLHSVPDPSGFFRRRVWLSTRLAPLHGWHVQQLRRIAIAQQVSDAALVYCDSDVVFLKPFDLSVFWRDGRLRLYRRDGALPMDSHAGHTSHADWARNAAEVLGLAQGADNRDDYISTVIAWRRETVLAMIRHLEMLHQRHWVEAIAMRRHFSECLVYGRFVDEIQGGEGHFHDALQFCRVYWEGPSLSGDGLQQLVASMTSEQVAIGVQSFTGTDLGSLRKLLA